MGKVTSRGRITVPKAVRERLDLAPGDRIDFVEEAGHFNLRLLSRASHDAFDPNETSEEVGDAPTT